MIILDRFYLQKAHIWNKEAVKDQKRMYVCFLKDNILVVDTTVFLSTSSDADFAGTINTL